jgi:hypothetical protein
MFIWSYDGSRRRLRCDCDGSDNYKGEHFFIALSVLACITVIFSILEFGVGGAASNIVLEHTTTSKWGGIRSVIAGVLALVGYKRGFLISSYAIAVAILGYWNDGLPSFFLSELTACTSQSSYGASPMDYGSNSSYENSRYCFKDVDTSVVLDTCYCSSFTKTLFMNIILCEEYTLTSSAKASGYNCGSLFTTYPTLPRAFWVLNKCIAMLAFIMSMASCAIARKPREILRHDET